MTNALADVEAADRISRRRARWLIVCGVLFLTGQGLWFTEGQPLSPVRAGIWLLWALTLLALLATGGGLILRKSLRQLMNDETTRANRLRAYALGFWAAAGSALGLYVVSMMEDVPAADAIHIILTAAIGAALLNFGLLERRLHDGA